MSVWERAMREADVRVELPVGEVMCFRKIPACREGFLMGSRGFYAQEEPRHRVVIEHEFYLGTFVVTQGQYRELAGAAGERLRVIEGNKGDDPSDFKGERRPVETVSWDEAMAVCDWLNESGRLAAAGLPSGWQARLPTEAEWEYACRGKAETEYYNGDGEAALAAVGWYEGNAKGETHPVDEKEESHPFGLHGMHGNVWEWCLDGWDETVYRARPDLWRAEVWPDMELVRSTPYRVLRGGSWNDAARYCRSAYRLGIGPDSRCRYFGFRVCLVPGPPVQTEETAGSGATLDPGDGARRDDAAESEGTGGAKGGMGDLAGERFSRAAGEISGNDELLE